MLDIRLLQWTCQVGGGEPRWLACAAHKHLQPLNEVIAAYFREKGLQCAEVGGAEETPLLQKGEEIEGLA